MINTVHYVSLFEWLEGLVDDPLVAAVDYSRDHLGSKAAELVLDSGEGKFYWIPVRSICNVPDPTVAQILQGLLAIWRFMHI